MSVDPLPVSEAAAETPVIVYWRPGCGFCSSLLRKLDASGLAFERENIWDDEDAAAFVRLAANGNETVPTVRVGDLALVNPTADEVLRELAAVAPDQLPEGYTPPEPGRIARVFGQMLGG